MSSQDQIPSFLPLLQNIVASLVENPAEVKIEEQTSFRNIVYSVKVAQPDVGKVIGKQGRTAEAIKTIMSNIGGRRGFKVIVDIYMYPREQTA